MLTRRTVLILGAGASKPYDFPIGAELSELIIQRLRSGGEYHAFLRERLGHSAQELDNFRDEFFYSGKASIDAFLEHRKDLVDLGKKLIALTLIPFENSASLFRFQNSWLRYMFSKLNSSFDDFQNNQLSIITFNYDRCVEHFLFTA